MQVTGKRSARARAVSSADASNPPVASETFLASGTVLFELLE